MEEAYDVMVVVPTIMGGDYLLPTTRRLFQHHNGLRVLIVLSVNPVDPQQAHHLLNEIYTVPRPDNVGLIVHCEDGPIGFGAANNRGLMKGLEYCAEHGGNPRFVVFHNDDAFVADGWLPGLDAAFKTDRVCVWGEVWTMDPSEDPRGRPTRSVEGFGTIGIVGPASNLVAGIQQIQPPEKMGPDAAADWARRTFPRQVVTADFVSGFCMALTMDAVLRLMLRRTPAGTLLQIGDIYLADYASPAVGVFDEDQYPIAGYEDNDLCVRAEIAGIRCAAVPGVYVSHLGHQSFDVHWPEMMRGMRNRIAHYRKWAHFTQRENG